MPQVASRRVRAQPPQDPQQSDTVTVHLTEQRNGWHVTVTRAGRAAAFVAEHRDGAGALAMVQQIAAVEQADLRVRTAAGPGAGVQFVPAARVAATSCRRARAAADAGPRCRATELLSRRIGVRATAGEVGVPERLAAAVEGIRD
jgi:hypothetical protein